MHVKADKVVGNRPDVRRMFSSDRVPLYYQLQGILTDQIESGVFTTGSRLPTEAQLEKEYGVSRITVRQALSAMEEKGLIHRAAGRGTFVNERKVTSGEALQLEGSLDALISLGISTKVKVLSIRRVKASVEEASVLGLEPGADLIRCARIRSYRNEPFSHVVNDLPYEIGKRLTRSDWARSVSQVLQEKLGIPLIEARQSIRASLATGELARLLSTRIGSPLLLVDRVVMTEDSRPVDRVRTSYRSDIFQFNVHLSKDDAHGDWVFSRAGKGLAHPAAKVGRNHFSRIGG